MWASLIPVAISAVSSIVQNSQRKDYQETLKKQQMTMPSGITEAEMIYQQLANVGLPGAEKMKENLFATAAANLSEARRTTGNMSDYMEILNRAFTGAEDRASGIDIQDAQAKAANMGTLAQFLSGVKAPAEQNIQNFNIQKALDIEREKMNSTNNIFKTIEAGVGSGMDIYGKQMYQDYLNNYLESMKASWGTGDPGSTRFAPSNQIPPNAQPLQVPTNVVPQTTTPPMNPNQNMNPNPNIPYSNGGANLSPNTGQASGIAPAVSYMDKRFMDQWQVIQNMYPYLR